MKHRSDRLVKDCVTQCTQVLQGLSEARHAIVYSFVRIIENAEIVSLTYHIRFC